MKIKCSKAGCGNPSGEFYRNLKVKVYYHDDEEPTGQDEYFDENDEDTTGQDPIYRCKDCDCLAVIEE